MNTFKKISLLCCGLSLLWLAPLASAKSNPEISGDARLTAAEKVLSETESAITVYVKGLCCPSCAIGIRKKVSKLDFVDTKRLDKGVELDTKTQLATIAVKGYVAVEIPALAQAIRDAGYDPFHLYQSEKGRVITTEIPQENE